MSSDMVLKAKLLRLSRVIQRVTQAIGEIGMKRSVRRRRGGFSLLEIMLVLVILVVVGGIVAFNFGGIQTAANERAAKAQMNQFQSFLSMYRIEVGTLPANLDALYEKPGDLADPTRWRQISEKPIPADPWQRPYVYKLVGDKYELRCVGADGQENTDDDIVM